MTYHIVSASNVVQVHTFVNEHNHIMEDVITSQPLVRSNHESTIIDEVIQSTLDYQPHQICENFVREHGMRLTCYQE